MIFKMMNHPKESIMKKLIRRKVVLLAIILIAVFNFNQLFAHLNSFSSIVKS